ncbi:MAG: hypothetical protein UZ19_OD1000901 [Parcubacteria bacterium OLB19]|nr:MAG: hypothetical protein UZ19_OD1000901 [Parcubacteria bacterium OLB19]
MNLEVISSKNTQETPKKDIEDAVVVEEVSGAKKEVETVNVSEESEEVAELKAIESLNTLEEVEEAFLVAKAEFEKLIEGKEETDTIKSAKSLFVLFDRVSKQDETTEKNIKNKYLKGLRLFIDELRSETVVEAQQQSEENVIPQTTEEKPNPTEKVEGEEQKPKRWELLLHKKTEYKEKQAEFDQKLEEFYKSYDSNYLKKAGRFFGFQPDLPHELIDLDVKCRELKKDYVTNLDLSIKNRYGEKHEKKSDAFNIAFANKFILKPNQKFLEKQESYLLNEKQREQRDRILKTLSANKQSIRLGIIVLAGVSGALTGGLSAGLSLATFQGVKMVGSIFASTATGLGVKNLLQKGVDKAYANAEDLKKNFSVDDLDNFEKELLLAEKTKRGAERTQMVASAGAAFVAGGVASYALHNTDFSQLFSGKGANSVAVESADSGSRFAGSGPKIDMSGEKDAFLSDDGVVSAPTASSAGLSTESVTETPEIYSVERGDTLWQIMEKRYASELDGLSTVEKNRVLDTLFDKVRDDAGLLKSLELKSHDNIDLIYTGEKINLTALGKELERMADIERGEGVLPPYVKQSSLPVQDGGGVVQQIPIKSQEVPDSVVKTESPLPKVVISEPAPISPDIPPPPKGLPPDNYFKTPSYTEEVKRVFGGEQHFNRVLGREILDVEKRAYDWLTPRERFTSPYEFFKVMKIEDIERLSQDPNVRIHVQQYGMKYEAFLAWVDKIREMKASGLPSTPGTYLSDLFSRYMVEKFSGRIK